MKGAAYVISQSVAAMAEIEAMKVANYEKQRISYSPTYHENDFLGIIDRYQLGHNQVCQIFAMYEGR